MTDSTGHKRNGLVAAAVVGVLAIGGGTAYLVSSGSSHTKAVVGSAPVVSASPTPGGGALQPGGPNKSAPSGKGAAQTAKSYLSSGSSLTVYFYGRACMRYTVTADESTASKVVVHVTGYSTAKIGEMCSMLVYLAHDTVTLKTPLNGRTVVDADSAKNLPVQMGLPGSLPSSKVTHGPVSQSSS